MKVVFNGYEYEFIPWRPAAGRVFDRAFAFDCETTLIDNERPWLTPAYVLGAAFDGKHGVFVPRPQLPAFFAAHVDSIVVFHNAAFDLDVLNTAAPDTKVYDRVEANRVRDTQLMHRLLTLGEAGHTSHGKGESTLEHCAATYLDVALPKDTTDSAGNPVRLSYGQFLTRPLSEMEPVYLEYLAADVVATFHVYSTLVARTRELLQKSDEVWGYVSDDWLRTCLKRFGPQTHHLQLKAAIVLRSISANGLHLDTARRDELATSLKELVNTQKAALRKFGYLPGREGADKSLQAVLQRRAWEQPHLTFPKTETGKFATAYDALYELVAEDPFVKLLLEYRETEKLLGSFVGKMAKPVLHPSFNVLARTGRTTSFGEINAQNLPKADAVRACFVPRPGYEFLDADYATVELATLAQSSLTQFGLDSQMAVAINNGQDLHRLVAARMLGKPPNAVTKEERQKAKAVNFGKPGGMGVSALTAYAKVNYGAALSLEEAEDFSESWFDQFPEMRPFLADATDTAGELAALLQLTPASHHAFTDDRRFVAHPENDGRADQPHEILGMMLLKVIKEPNPTTAKGKLYSEADCDYFWTQLDAGADRLPTKHRKAIRDRDPSPALQWAVMGLVGRAGVFTLSGRLRANASYCARHNTVFQGLAADGAKLALWRLWRAGYRLVNFIHDQVLIEIPACTPRDRMDHAQTVRRHMIDGMREVVPDVKIDVSFAAADRWYKDAEAVPDASGEGLLLWVPASTNDVETRAACA